MGVEIIVLKASCPPGCDGSPHGQPECNKCGDVHRRIVANVERCITCGVESPMASLPDGRFSVGLEFTGAYEPVEGLLPGQRWVARFCGEWLGSRTTEREARRKACTWHDERERAMVAAHRARLAELTARAALEA